MNMDMTYDMCFGSSYPFAVHRRERDFITSEYTGHNYPFAVRRRERDFITSEYTGHNDVDLPFLCRLSPKETPGGVSCEREMPGRCKKRLAVFLLIEKRLRVFLAIEKRLGVLINGLGF